MWCGLPFTGSLQRRTHVSCKWLVKISFVDQRPRMLGCRSCSSRIVRHHAAAAAVCGCGPAACRMLVGYKPHPATLVRVFTIEDTHRSCCCCSLNQLLDDGDSSLELPSAIGSYITLSVSCNNECFVTFSRPFWPSPTPEHEGIRDGLDC